MEEEQRVADIKKRLLLHYPKAKTELKYNSLYELLIAVMLSAQCTDKRVNKITPFFYKKFPDIASLANSTVNDIWEIIKSCSYPNNKAKNLYRMAQVVMREFKGKIPENEKELIRLPGIGRKSANVVMIEYFKKDLMAVDTHVFRVSHRLGLSKAKTVLKTEEDLTKVFKKELNLLHHAMVLFGRYICTARKPKCNKCFLKELCSKMD
jgi:endonuclease-3